MNKYIEFSIIRDIANELGFQDCGASKAEEVDISFFEKWLNKGYDADMHYMRNYLDKRNNPSLLLEDSKSIISFIVSYNSYNPDNKDNKTYNFASYSHYYDYHKSIKLKFLELINRLQQIYPDFIAIPYVDSAPILEKYWAKTSGLGSIGRNSLLINKEYGSKILIGEIITNYSTDYHISQEEDLCKDCRKCVDACPNGAINNDKTIDSRLCNAYHTIENKGEIPNNINLNSFVFGCDICINACPWNKNTQVTDSKILTLNTNMQILIDSINNNNAEKTIFNKAKKNSPIERIKFEKLLSNIKESSKH